MSCDYIRGAQPFCAKGRFVLFLGHSRAEDKILSWTFESRVYKNWFFLYLTSRFIACDLIFLPSKFFWIVISCKIFNSSIKFTYIQIISVIQEMFLVFFYLLRGPDITRSGAGSGLRVVHPWIISSSTVFFDTFKANKDTISNESILKATEKQMQFIVIKVSKRLKTVRDVPGTNFLPGTEYRVLRRFFTGSGYRVPGI